MTSMIRLPLRHALVLAALLAVGFGVGTGRAAAADLVGRYQVATTGIAIGQAELALTGQGAAQSVGFSFENGSLLGLVEASSTRMSGELALKGGEVTPRSYRNQFRKSDREREVRVTYGPQGAIDRFELLKGGEVRFAKIPAGLPAGTMDPLTALLRLRGWLGSAMAGDVTELAVFDGRKVYRTSLRYQGPVQTNQYGDSLAAHLVSVSYRQVAQLDEDKGTLRQEGDRERKLDLLLSADGRYLPLRVSGSFDGLPLTAELDADCLGAAGCKPGKP